MTRARRCMNRTLDGYASRAAHQDGADTDTTEETAPGGGFTDLAALVMERDL